MLSKQIYYHHITRGIERVILDTGLHGRWEIIKHDPLTICETAHNAPGVQAMLDKLSTLHFRKLHIIYGCVNDKDYLSILKMLPTNATYYLTQPSVPRALPVADLAQGFKSLFPSDAALDAPASTAVPILHSTYPSVKKAISAARAAASKDDLVLVTGSIFLVADALA